MLESDSSDYDFSEDDPYYIEGSTCLVNCLGITDTALLNEAEVELSELTASDLRVNPVSGHFDLAHLQEIHRRLFCDVYPFAGQIRTVDISKGGQMFLPYRSIPEVAHKIFSSLQDERFLLDLDVVQFSERVGEYLARINVLHPFREGNGRTQRIFIDQLAAANGYVIEWNAISQFAMIEACSEYMSGLDATAHKLKRMMKVHLRSTPI